MSLELVLARISALEQAFSPPIPPPAVAPTVAAAPSTGASFKDNLKQALAPAAVGGTPPLAGPAPAGGSPAQRIVAAAEGEVGQAEQPPGSNDSPRIGQYRQATAGAPGPGPWCAYFASWVARQAGVPLGDHGQGFGSVDQLWAWAQRSGKAVPRGQPPQAGDLIILNQHMGVVESVLPDGRIKTIEGNYSDRVSRVVRQPSEALGFVRPAQ